METVVFVIAFVSLSVTIVMLVLGRNAVRVLGLGIESLLTFAAIVLCMQATAALSVLAIGLAPGRGTVPAR